jgi:hypothetical protein
MHTSRQINTLRAFRFCSISAWNQARVAKSAEARENGTRSKCERVINAKVQSIACRTDMSALCVRLEIYGIRSDKEQRRTDANRAPYVRLRAGMSLIP